MPGLDTPAVLSSCGSQSPSPGQGIGDQLRAVGAADREDDVLPAVDHVGHGRSRLLLRHVHGSHICAGRLVVGAQQGHALPGFVRMNAAPPAISRLFVASTPMNVRPYWPSRGSSRPFRAG